MCKRLRKNVIYLIFFAKVRTHNFQSVRHVPLPFTQKHQEVYLNGYSNEVRLTF